MKITILLYGFFGMLHTAERKTNAVQLVEWYSFLDSLYSEFSSYTYQKNCSRYNVSNLNDWGQDGKPQGLRIDHYNFEKFIKLVNGHHGGGSTHLFSNGGDAERLKSLNHVLDLTLRQKPRISCRSGTTLVVTGNFVKVSDLPTPLSCSSGKQAQTIEIFAMDTVFIDVDLVVKGPNAVLAIMAPVWSVQGVRNIRLFAGTQPSKPSKAASARKRGDHGADGRPGAPGVASGNFLGLGRVFVNGKNLTITTKGGRGGAGQDGGDGAEGIWGRDGKIKDNRFNCKMTRLKTKECYGENGKRGGNGGNGGKGGFGGLPGLITIFHLKEKSLIKEVESKGDVGVSGKGGKGGIGGYKGNGEKKVLHPTKKARVVKDYTRSPSGHNGAAGKNSRSQAKPKPATPLNNYLKTILSDYKNYLLTNLNIEFAGNKVFDNLIEIFTNGEILKRSQFPASLIIDDFLMLENHFHSLFGKVDLLFLYQEFQKHIENQTQHMNLKNKETLKVWIFLYAATISKICTLETSANGRFIRDLDSFLDMFVENIKKLKDVHQDVLIAKRKKEYKSGIDQEIKEAKSVINDYVIPNVKHLSTRTLDNIKTLIDEADALKKKAKDNEGLYKKVEQKLKTNLIVNGFSNAYTFFTDTLLPLGGLAKSVMDVGKSAFGLLVDKDAGKIPDEFFDLQQYVYVMQNAVTEDKRKKIENFKNEINTIKSLINETPDQYKHTFNELDKIAAEMDSWDPYDDLTEKFEQRMNKVGQNLQILTRSLGNPKNIQNVFYVNRVRNIMEGLETYLKGVEDDKEKIKVILEKIEENREHIQLINNYKKTIKSSLRPMLETLKKLIDSLGKSVANKSAVKLDVIGDHIKRYLTKVLWVVQDFTKHFKTGPEFDHSIKSIQDAVSSLIRIYQRIQEYQKQKKLADYLADTSSNHYKSIVVKDSKIADALTQLELSLQKNIILLEYTQSINQLKLFVFPLAKIYFKDFNLPLVLQQNRTKESFLLSAIDQIELFRNKISEANTFITKYDRLKQKAAFYWDSTVGPFFVWYNRYHRHSIRKLLAGEEVVFLTDVNKRPENAIKFNLIDLRLKSKKNQKKLNKILEDFTVVMTHPGNNYFNCDNTTYVVNTESVRFLYSFQKLDGEPVNTNLAFEKLREGDFMLSPFTNWKIRLTNATPGGYNLLRGFADEVDLELGGEGEFFDKDPDLCEENLDEYYDLLDMSRKTLSECLRAETTRSDSKKRRWCRSFLSNVSISSDEKSLLSKVRISFNENTELHIP